MTLVALPIPTPAEPKKPDVRERHAPSLADAFVTAITEYTKGLPDEQILLALAKLSPAQVVIDLLDFKRLDLHLTAALVEPILASFKDGWAREVKALTTSPLLLKVAKAEAVAPEPDFAGSFNTVNPEAVKAAREQVGKLITQATTDQQDNVRAVIAKGFTEGIPPRQLAQMVGAAAGMTTRQLNAFMNYSSQLVTKAKEKYPKGVPMQVQALQERQMEAYKLRLLRQRGMLIAQTETIHAANLGQHALWLSAIDQGYLGKDVQRRWITAKDERPCPICFALDGQIVSMTGQFNVINGSTTLTPPAHPRCRCGTGLVDAAAVMSEPKPIEPEPEPVLPGEMTPDELDALANLLVAPRSATETYDQVEKVRQQRADAVKEALTRIDYPNLVEHVARRVDANRYSTPVATAEFALQRAIKQAGLEAEHPPLMHDSQVLLEKKLQMERDRVETMPDHLTRPMPDWVAAEVDSARRLFERDGGFAPVGSDTIDEWRGAGDMLTPKAEEHLQALVKVGEAVEKRATEKEAVLRVKRDEADAKLMEVVRRQIDASTNYREAYQQRETSAREGRTPEPSFDEVIRLEKIYKAALREREKASAVVDEVDKLIGRATFDALAEIRPMGGDLKVARSTNAKALANVLDAGKTYYPTAWMEKANSRAQATIKMNNSRAYARGSTITVPTKRSDMENRSTALHELGHYMETFGGINISHAEWLFYLSRTAGEKLVSMRAATGEPYPASEKPTRKDQFASAYMGKDYGYPSYRRDPHKNYELLTMGMESLYNPNSAHKLDPGYRRWLLGLLALV